MAGLISLAASAASGQPQPTDVSVPVKAPAPVRTAQGPAGPQSRFDPQAAFAPLDLSQAVNRYRSGDGAPGPDYWQNRADYDIAARLDPATRTIAGSEVITYTNNSPSVLTSLWLQLDQNVYRPTSREAVLDSDRKPGDVTSGYAIDAVAVEPEGGGTGAPAPYLVSDTRMQVHLDRPLKGGGAKLKLRIAYHYAAPGLFGGRTAWVNTRNGPIFDIAQWYPRMCVFDDVRGWDTLPYLAQEFYLEYGDIDYAVTVPAGMMVMGTGELINPQDVLTPQERDRLARARASDATVMIRTPDDVAKAASAPAPPGQKTWRYHMDNTRDVACGARQPRLHLGRRAHQPAGTAKKSLADERLPARERRPRRMGQAPPNTLKDTIAALLETLVRHIRGRQR